MTDISHQDEKTAAESAGIGAHAAAGEASYEAIRHVPVRVRVVLGESAMPISRLLDLGRGAIVELDRKAGETVDIYVNDRFVARGDVVIGEDGRLGVSLTETVNPQLGLN